MCIGVFILPFISSHLKYNLWRKENSVYTYRGLINLPIDNTGLNINAMINL